MEVPLNLLSEQEQIRRLISSIREAENQKSEALQRQDFMAVISPQKQLKRLKQALFYRLNNGYAVDLETDGKIVFKQRQPQPN